MMMQAKAKKSSDDDYKKGPPFSLSPSQQRNDPKNFTRESESESKHEVRRNKQKKGRCSGGREAR